MNTFSVLLKCLPFFAFVGLGLNSLLIALVPSWREKGWTHWKRYGTDQARDSRSLLVQLGFAKPAKPIGEGDFSEKEAVTLYLILGSFFVIIGLCGLCLIVYLSIQ